MGPKGFYGRAKIGLADLRQVRTEMCVAYRPAAKKELDWQDLRAAIAALVAIANLDQGLGADERLAEIEEKLGTLRPNGHAPEEARASYFLFRAARAWREDSWRA